MSRATKKEMAVRHAMLVDLVAEHGPCSVRHIFYRATVVGVPGITKNQSGYNKVQRAVLDLRRSGDIPYHLIVDNTRWRRQPTVWTGADEVLNHVAATYRRNLWDESAYRVEVWCESDSIAGTILPVTDKWAVPLFVCRGQSSETFAHSAVDEWEADLSSKPIILYIGDLDPHGLEIEEALEEKLFRFHRRAQARQFRKANSDIDMTDVMRSIASDLGYGPDAFDGVVFKGPPDVVTYPDFEMQRLAVTWEQVEAGDLPGSPPKKQFRHPRSVEAEALPPKELVALLDSAIEEYVDPDQLKALKVAEESEREIFRRLAEAHG